MMVDAKQIAFGCSSVLCQGRLIVEVSNSWTRGGGRYQMTMTPFYQREIERESKREKRKLSFPLQLVCCLHFTINNAVAYPNSWLASDQILSPLLLTEKRIMHDQQWSSNMLVCLGFNEQQQIFLLRKDRRCWWIADANFQLCFVWPFASLLFVLGVFFSFLLRVCVNGFWCVIDWT